MFTSIRTELSFVLANQPGTLGDVLTALARAKVNLLAVDATGGFEYNIVRLVPDKTGKAKGVLRRQGLDVGEAKVLCVGAKDQPGALARVAAVLGRARINIDYLYASGGKPGGEAVIVLHPADIKKAAKLVK